MDTGENTMIRYTPWTPEEVKSLQQYQDDGFAHPYTCICDGDNGHHPNLIPTIDGWMCPKCDYKQDWFHSMALKVHEAYTSYVSKAGS